MCIHAIVLDNGLVVIFRGNEYTTIEQFLETPFSIRYVYQRRICGSVCVSSCCCRQLLAEHVPAATNTHKRIVEGVVFYTARVVSKESLWVCVYPPVVSRQRL
jgi:hypothetical protein